MNKLIEDLQALVNELNLKANAVGRIETPDAADKAFTETKKRAEELFTQLAVYARKFPTAGLRAKELIASGVCPICGCALTHTGVVYVVGGAALANKVCKSCRSAFSIPQ